MCNEREGIIQYRNALESSMAISGCERLVLGGDSNASVGRGNWRQGVCGKYSLGRMNEAGEDLIDWYDNHVFMFLRM